MPDWTLIVVGGSFAVAIGLYVWMGRSRTGMKQCPECGAYVGVDEHKCEYCGYEFEPATV